MEKVESDTSIFFREIDAYRTIFSRELALSINIIEVRLNAMDKAILLLHDISNRSPTVAEVDLSIISLKSIMEEKLNGIKITFDLNEKNINKKDTDSKIALDAALSAAKEAVSEQNKSNVLSIDKSEKNTTKQLDSIGTVISQITSTLNDKIDDLKTRLMSIESSSNKGEKDIKMLMVVIGIGLSFTAVVIPLLNKLFSVSH